MPSTVPILTNWVTPATSYPDSRVGRARIDHPPYKRGYYEAYGLRGIQVYRVAKPIPICRLRIGRKTWMVDDPAHWWAMQDHANFYHGDVLVAGLGLGLIVHTLNANSAVKKIVVVEQERDVIDLVLPHLPKEKLEVVHGDFWKYDGAADGVFYDLFVGDGRQLANEALHVFVQLAQEFPRPIRIHGFNNDYFNKLWDAVADKAGRPSADERRVLRDHGNNQFCIPGKWLRRGTGT